MNSILSSISGGLGVALGKTRVVVSIGKVGPMTLEWNSLGLIAVLPQGVSISMPYKLTITDLPPSIKL